MYIKKMFSLVSSEPPFTEVPNLIYTQDTIELKGIAETNGKTIDFDAIITDCIPITNQLGTFSIFGFIRENGAEETSHLIGIIKTSPQEESALFMAVH